MGFRKPILVYCLIREFLKILSDEEGNLLNVFEDNVRDFKEKIMMLTVELQVH